MEENCNDTRIVCSIINLYGDILYHDVIFSESNKSDDPYFSVHESFVFYELERRGFIGQTYCIDYPKLTNPPQVKRLMKINKEKLASSTVTGAMRCDTSYELKVFTGADDLFIVKRNMTNAGNWVVINVD